MSLLIGQTTDVLERPWYKRYFVHLLTDTLHTHTSNITHSDSMFVKTQNKHSRTKHRESNPLSILDSMDE